MRWSFVAGFLMIAWVISFFWMAHTRRIGETPGDIVGQSFMLTGFVGIVLIGVKLCVG